jgi:signal peptidase II
MGKGFEANWIGSFLVFLLVALIVVAGDQYTKYLIRANMVLGESIEVIPHYLNIVHTSNAGAAFGLMSESDSVLRSVFLIGVSALVIVGLPIIAISQALTNKWLAMGFGLFWGGAVGNLIDRLRFGEVTDFIDAHIHYYHWPAFNVADASLCAAAFLIIVNTLFSRQSNFDTVD